MANEDVFDSFESTLRGRSAVNPWAPPMPDGSQSFSPDYDLVTALADIPLAGGSGSESGRLAKAIDAWVAYELRRAGFGDDEVWPRLTKPRVLPRDVAVFLAGLPAKEREAAHERLLKNKRVAQAPAGGRCVRRMLSSRRRVGRPAGIQRGGDATRPSAARSRRGSFPCHLDRARVGTYADRRPRRGSRSSKSPPASAARGRRNRPRHLAPGANAESRDVDALATQSRAEMSCGTAAP